MADINVAGVWKTPVLSINVGGVWKTPEEHINVAGVWKKTNGPQVSTTYVTSQFNSGGGTVFAGLRFDSDGNMYAYTAGGGTVLLGSWLVAGLNSEVWVSRTLNTGTLTSDGIGTGRAQLSTDRAVYVSSATLKSCTLSFYFWDAASGGNQIASKLLVTFEAESL